MKLLPVLVVLFLIYLITPSASAGNISYTVDIYAPADLAVRIDAPSKASVGSPFSVIANLTNSGTENVLNASAELIFLDRDNDLTLSRRVFIYSHPVKRITTLRGTNFQTVIWNVKTRSTKKNIGNYSIVIRAEGSAEISGDELTKEEQKGIVLESRRGLFSWYLIFSEFVQDFSWPPIL